MKRIKLPTGEFAIFDDEDYELVNQYTWYLHVTPTGRQYVRTTWKKKNKSMHRLIMKAKKGQVVDHRNGNGLDNRRCNLRLCTMQENIRNMKPRPHSSKYKGVSKGKDKKKWSAQIELGKRKVIRLGTFVREVDAARAYDDAALKHFGEFAYINGVK